MVSVLSEGLLNKWLFSLCVYYLCVACRSPGNLIYAPRPEIRGDDPGGSGLV